MAYIKQEFKSGDKLYAAQLNAMDAQIAANEEETIRLSEEMARKDKPLVYIDGAIPTTKDNVLAEMRVMSGWLNFHAYIKIKCQGTSSMAYPKKNFTVTLYQDAARTVPLYITIPGWKHPANKFVLKANYIDHLHARNIISARLWSEIVASRPDYDTLPEEFRNSPNNGAVDGFPIIVYTNGAYQGVYTWNIGKDAWLWGMNEDNPNHVLMCAETNTNKTYAETPCNFRALWSGVNETDWSVEVGENSDAVKNALNDLIGFVMNATDDEFVAQIETYLDVQSAIDYYLFSCANLGIDNLGKNMLLGTYGLRKWMLGQYDLDSTWGLYWDGSKFLPANTACPDGYQEAFSLLFERIVKLYKERFVTRGRDLRETVLSAANITAHFERYAAEIGAEAYADDLIVYPSIPSAESNTIWQIRNFVEDRLVYFDGWLDEISGIVEDALYPLTNGVYSSSGSGMTMTITNGNHIKIEQSYSDGELYANFSGGAIWINNTIFDYTDKIFSLKSGDRVRRSISNISATGYGDATASLSQNLYATSADGTKKEVKFGADKVIPTVGESYVDEITVGEDLDVGAVIMWRGNLAGVTTPSTLEFDINLYVNDVRYI